MHLIFHLFLRFLLVLYKIFDCALIITTGRSHHHDVFFSRGLFFLFFTYFFRFVKIDVKAKKYKEDERRNESLKEVFCEKIMGRQVAYIIVGMKTKGVIVFEAT